ncbi:Uncharacterised protein [Klebsiella pneumoniae]|nr:Uncharacterised protein [Klebsiella pneumoniae]
MNLGKISFIISMISLLLMLLTFNLNPIINTVPKFDKTIFQD